MKFKFGHELLKFVVLLERVTSCFLHEYAHLADFVRTKFRFNYSTSRTTSLSVIDLVCWVCIVELIYSHVFLDESERFFGWTRRRLLPQVIQLALLRSHVDKSGRFKSFGLFHACFRLTIPLRRILPRVIIGWLVLVPLHRSFVSFHRNLHLYHGLVIDVVAIASSFGFGCR